MKSTMTYMKKGVAIILLLVAGMPIVMAATNDAANSVGGGTTLTDSGNVTVTASTLALVKQVYDTSGNCLASSPADAGCNTSATAVVVPAGTALRFMIFVRNDTDLALPDIRFTDALDETGTGFTFTAASMKYVDTPTDVETIANIYTAVDGGTGQTDALGGPDDFMSKVGGTIAVGAVTGQASTTVNVPARKTFAMIFNATKN